MRPVFQTKFTKDGRLGNCLAACVASLTHRSISNVPAFEELRDTNEVKSAVREFLTRLGWDFQERKLPPAPKDNRFYIASFEIPGREDVVHAVIVRNGKIVHDPRPVDMRVPLGDMHSYIDARRKRCPQKRSHAAKILPRTTSSSLPPMGPTSLAKLANVVADALVASAPSS